MFTLRLEPLDAANTQAVSALQAGGTQPQAEPASLLGTEGLEQGHRWHGLPAAILPEPLQKEGLVSRA